MDVLSEEEQRVQGLERGGRPRARDTPTGRSRPVVAPAPARYRRRSERGPGWNARVRGAGAEVAGGRHLDCFNRSDSLAQC